MISLKKGFSLIEVLIVVTIIGTFLSFAIPSYSQHITYARRVTAETALMRLAGQMETFFAQHNTYEGATLASLNSQEWVAEKNYRLAIRSASTSHFELAAIPQNQQVKRDTRCGMLTLNSRGIKHASLDKNVNECW